MRARSLQLEQTLEAVARSVGERRERMPRLTGAGSRNSGSEQPAGHRWCKPEYQEFLIYLFHKSYFKCLKVMFVREVFI